MDKQDEQNPLVGVGNGALLSEDELKERWGKSALWPATDFDTHVKSALVDENVFRRVGAEDAPLPQFSAAKHTLAVPVWDGHDDAIACYWKAWELAYANLRKPTKESGFVSNYIDTAFNECLFMWDSSFIVLFTRYASHADATTFHNTLNNLYARQHADGFICREIRERDGKDLWYRSDVVSTGPNILGWAEWQYFEKTGDLNRLKLVFPVLVAFHRWFRTHRSWQDGSYFSCGGGCGMDNQPRAMSDMNHQATFYEHGHMSWIDTTFQQLLNCEILIKMAAQIGRAHEIGDLEEEQKRLCAVVNSSMWDDTKGFFVDKAPNNTLSTLNTIGAYWGLLTTAVAGERAKRLVAHLNDKETFNREHRVPSMPANHPKFKPTGGYWLGAVWAPTTYMVLQGLANVQELDLAHDIAVNHLGNVVNVFNKTGTLWENYSSESASAGSPAKPDFVGWTGLPPIAVLFEFVFGIRPDVPNGTVHWNIRLCERHGISKYPFGKQGVLELICNPRDKEDDVPCLTISANIKFNLQVTWGYPNPRTQTHTIFACDKLALRVDGSA